MAESIHKIEVGDLSLTGCGDCALAQWVNGRVEGLPPSENLSQMNFLCRIRHYAIELNGLKSEHNPHVSQENRLADDEIVTDILLQGGYSIEEAEEMTPLLASCVDCPNPLQVQVSTYVDGQVVNNGS